MGIALGAPGVQELRQEPRTTEATARFEWIFLGLCTWLMGGAYLDAWANRHLARLETFFTPWHAVLYSGMFAVLTFLAVTALVNQARGQPSDRVLPHGYGLSLAGCVLFGIGGVIDMFWHLRFGIEYSLGALISPPHLLLMLAGSDRDGSAARRLAPSSPPVPKNRRRLRQPPVVDVRVASRPKSATIALINRRVGGVTIRLDLSSGSPPRYRPLASLLRPFNMDDDAVN